MTTLAASSDLLIGQWLASPKLRAAIDAPVAALQAMMDELDKLPLQRQIETAEGVWLDYLGSRLGLARPATVDPASDARFGFTGPEQSRGFDQAPFRGLAENDAVFPLPDAIYRRFLRARAILVLGDGTLDTFTRAVQAIDPGAKVQDRRNMHVRILTSHEDQLRLADTVGALPRSAGVSLEYALADAFGYDEAGQPFDVAPFRG